MLCNVDGGKLNPAQKKTLKKHDAVSINEKYKTRNMASQKIYENSLKSSDLKTLNLQQRYFILTSNKMYNNS